jgi:hypothetical protein
MTPCLNSTLGHLCCFDIIWWTEFYFPGVELKLKIYQVNIWYNLHIKNKT